MRRQLFDLLPSSRLDALDGGEENGLRHAGAQMSPARGFEHVIVILLAVCFRQVSAGGSIDLTLNYQASGFDVLIQMKEVFRIVAFFGCHQAIKVSSVSGGDAVPLLGGHEIYVSSG